MSVCVMCSLLVHPQSIEPDPYIPCSKVDIKQFIACHAKEQNVNPKLMLEIAKRESTFNPKAVGDGGKALSCFQFHKPTFESMEKKYGENLNYDSCFDQSKLASWAVKQGYGKAWTTYSEAKKTVSTS